MSAVIRKAFVTGYGVSVSVKQKAAGIASNRFFTIFTNQPRIFLRSASGVLMGVRPNFSTSTESTFDEKKAGIEGPI